MPAYSAWPLHLVDLVYPAAVAFRHGLGTLKIFIDDMSSPALTVRAGTLRYL
jgi:hypothetical protein